MRDFLVLIVAASQLVAASQVFLASEEAAAPDEDPIPLSTREHWMRKANEALSLLSSPCPVEAFGSVVVNHTARTTDGLGELVCMGINQILETGNPTLHGETQTINNCTEVLTNPNGPHKLSPVEAAFAFRDLSLYTNAEPCSMCASAIRWSGFKECIFGTNATTLAKGGRENIGIHSAEVFKRSWSLLSKTRLVQNVLNNETDPYFAGNSTSQRLVRKDATEMLAKPAASLLEWQSSG